MDLHGLLMAPTLAILIISFNGSVSLLWNPYWPLPWVLQSSS